MSQEIAFTGDGGCYFFDLQEIPSYELNLQVDFILLLDEFVYPPVTIDVVYQEVLEQAENFKKMSIRCM